MAQGASADASAFFICGKESAIKFQFRLWLMFLFRVETMSSMTNEKKIYFSFMEDLSILD
jgi:hypothetical protein